jgi:hypothetical protein
MSEYQYYEFLAIDRPLTPDEQQAVARLSSRVDPHPRRAVFTYSWSDFPGRAEEVLAKYYDAMIYMASWGSRQLVLRFPKGLVDRSHLESYLPVFDFEGRLSLSEVGEHAILNIAFHEEEGGDWIEGQGWLDRLAPLRNDILNGDYRALYLVWLKLIEVEEVRDTVREPPVPAGLGQLTPGLESLIEFFGIEESMVQAAAQASDVPDGASDVWKEQAIAHLSRQECERFLLQMTRGEPHASVLLERRLRALAGAAAPAMFPPSRTVAQLRALATAWRDAERERLAREAERKRVAKLQDLAQREPQVWAEVDELIQRTTGNAYQQAVELLVELCDLAIYQGTKSTFDQRLNQIYAEHSRRSGLLRRLHAAGLDPS